jgi:hypothetical protein
MGRPLALRSHDDRHLPGQSTLYRLTQMQSLRAGRSGTDSA